VGVHNRVDVSRAKPTVDESLQATRAAVEQKAGPIGRLKKMARRSPAGVEFDGPRTQNGEAHGRRLALC